MPRPGPTGRVYSISGRFGLYGSVEIFDRVSPGTFLQVFRVYLIIRLTRNVRYTRIIGEHPIFWVNRYPMIFKTEPGRAWYQKHVRLRAGIGYPLSTGPASPVAYDFNQLIYAVYAPPQPRPADLDQCPTPTRPSLSVTFILHCEIG